METTNQPASRPATHTIGDNESLAGIAERHGVTLQMLNGANPDAQLSVRRIQPGQTLEIPPSPLSASADMPREPEAQGFNPAFATPGGSSLSGRVRIADKTHGLEWSPATGSVRTSLEMAAPLPRLVPSEAPAGQGRSGNSQEYGVFEAEDGRYTVKVSAQVEAGAQSSVERGRVTLANSDRTGGRVQYAVMLPGEGLDEASAARAAAQVDPFNPTTLPVGGTVTLNGQHFESTSMQASFRRAGSGVALMTRDDVLEANGTSYAMTRVDDHTMQVVIGPNQAVEAFSGIGVQSRLATAMLGRADTLGSSELQTARFDISSPDGQAAYDHFLRSGEIQPGTPGVSDMTRIDRIDYASASRLELGLGPEQARLQAQLGGPENSGTSVRTTYADGSFRLQTDLQYGENVPLQVDRRFDAEGNELRHLRTYQFEIDASAPEYGWFERNLLGRDGEVEARSKATLVNRALGVADGEGVQAGQRVSLVLDERQMTALVADIRTADAARTGRREWDWMEAREANGKPVDNLEVAAALSRRINSGDHAFAESLRQIADGADGRYDGQLKSLDITLKQGDTVLHSPSSSPAAPAAAAADDVPAMVERLNRAAEAGPEPFRVALDETRQSPMGAEFQQRVDNELAAERIAEQARTQQPQPVEMARG